MHFDAAAAAVMFFFRHNLFVSAYFVFRFEKRLTIDYGCEKNDGVSVFQKEEKKLIESSFWFKNGNDDDEEHSESFHELQ